MNEEDEVARLRSLLAAAVKLSNTAQRGIEQKLEMSSGSLSRLFSGGIGLKVQHVLDVCEVIGLPPSHFFRAAYPELEKSSLEARRLLRLLAELHPEAGKRGKDRSAAPEAAPATREEIELVVMGVLGKLFPGRVR